MAVYMPTIGHTRDIEHAYDRTPKWQCTCLR